ncbi:MarR family transcriptional regulator [Oerskovia turbata]|uniref:MarR family transcriptional regulator n=1 Tax=Oerskovia turbata TaxID=1713 RepID=A0A4Q1KPC9_9CELL|nr:MarR family winged helix-turn-helix transcriptional regulator [Oerskovia turbata]RXR23109.1 MarR family transcriptional regulator [Oerskovia turbata]RXR31692.1 MarR family transcriptional regulator [Oerskovia turbata]TGJ97227.1 MarR family transcriptional regulator [Actinotalea fermentans ATCC 43279 = JCM 9966 = DSM 3133]
MDANPVSREPKDWPTGRLLSAVTRRIEREWNHHLDGWDLNHASMPVLLHLLAGPRTQRQLAAESHITEQTMSRILARLERSGYITREDDANDRRRRAVAITPSGRTAALAAASPRPAEELSTRGLSEEQIATLREILITMVEAHPRPGEG